MVYDVVVTGAAGFIGSHVVDACRARGERVLGLDNLDPFYPEAWKRRNLAEVGAAGPGAFDFEHFDITNHGALIALLGRARPRLVIHLAAKAGVRPSIEDPVGYAHANVTGTASVLDAAHRAGCERMVVASSSSVYGNNPKTPFSEDDRVDRPISPYAATKLATEALCATHQHLTGMPTACLRFFTVFGPRQRPDLAIRKFMRLIAGGQEIPYFGDGSASRDFTFVADVVAGILAAAERIPAHGYRVWNLGSDRPTRLDELVRAISRVMGREARLDRRPAQPGDVERTWADLTRSRAELGYRVETALEEGLERQRAWMERAGEFA